MGLFVDEELLRGKGLEPEGGEIAAIDGFALRIGQRAALVPTPGAKVYGLVFSLMRSERLNWIASILNRASRFTSHRPCSRSWPAEASSPPFATTFDSRRRLPERNPEYAVKLRAVSQKVGTPGRVTSHRFSSASWATSQVRCFVSAYAPSTTSLSALALALVETRPARSCPSGMARGRRTLVTACKILRARSCVQWT